MAAQEQIDTGEETDVPEVSEPMPLLDIAARSVAQSRSCDQLEKELLDEHVIQRIAFWAFPPDLDKILCVAGLVTTIDDWLLENYEDFYIGGIEVRQVGFMLVANLKERTPIVRHHVASHDVTISFEQQVIRNATCSSCPNQVFCSHVLVAIKYSIDHSEQVPVSMPMTESLATLTKQQLQNLVQQLVMTNVCPNLLALFNIYDEMKDSGLNKEGVGLVDATFGYTGSDTHWSQVLKSTAINYRQELIYYNELDDKPDLRKMDRFLECAVDMCIGEDFQEAADLLQVMTTEALRYIMEHEIKNTRVLVMVRKLMRILSLLVIWPPATPIREQIVDHVIACSQWFVPSDDYSLEPGKWAEFPSLTDSSETNQLEPLSAAQYATWPTGLGALLDYPDMDEAALLDFITNSPYDEELHVMVARFEALETFMLDGYEKSWTKLKLGMKIMQKTAAIMLQDSVLGAYLALPETEETSTVQASLKKHLGVNENTLTQLKRDFAKCDERNEEPSTSRTGGTARGRKRRRSTPRRAATKRYKNQDGDSAMPEELPDTDEKQVIEEPTCDRLKLNNIYDSDSPVCGHLSKHQVSFIMLEVCGFICWWYGSESDCYHSDNTDDKDCSCNDEGGSPRQCDNTNCQCNYNASDKDRTLCLLLLLSLEMSRSHLLTSNNMPDEATDLLKELVHDACTGFVSEKKTTHVITDIYLKVLRRFGASCFQGEYPLSMFSSILEVCRCNDEDNNPDIREDIFHTTASFLLDSKEPLAKFAKFSSYSDNLEEVFRSFLYFINLSDSEHCSIARKVLRHLADTELLSKMKMNQELEEFEKRLPSESLLRVNLVFCMLKTKTHPCYRTVITQVMKTVSMEALNEFTAYFDHDESVSEIDRVLRKLLSMWRNESEKVSSMIDAALEMFQPLAMQHKKDAKKLPESYVKLIMKYLSLPSVSDNKDVYLKMLEDEKCHFNRAFDQLLEECKLYSYPEVFGVMKILQPESKVTTFKQKTLKVLDVLLNRLHREPSMKLPVSIKQCLTWLLDLCTENRRTASVAFRELMNVLEENCRHLDSALVLEFVILYLEKSEKSFMLKYATDLGHILPEIYKRYLGYCFTEFRDVFGNSRGSLVEFLTHVLTAFEKYSPDDVQFTELIQSTLSSLTETDYDP